MREDIFVDVVLGVLVFGFFLLVGSTSAGVWMATRNLRAMNNERISLQDGLQFSWFSEALKIMQKNSRELRKYDAELMENLAAAFELSGRELTITRKQMNHIKQVALELESGNY